MNIKNELDENGKEIKSTVNQTIASSLEGFPEFLSSHHLVKLGIFQTLDCTYRARKNGNTPKYIKLKHKILYPKCEVISFLEGRLEGGMKEDADDKENQ